MTIKQNGGVFGRNPTFNDVTIEGQLTFDGDIDINSDLKVDGDLVVTGKIGVGTDTPSDEMEIRSTSPKINFTDSNDDTSGSVSYNVRALFLAADGTQRFFIGGDEKVRILETSGDVSLLGGGNLVVNSGSGIDFSATSGTGTSELLDDYEEGDWTPLIADASSGGNAGSGSVVGKYTKVGRQVTIIAVLNNIVTTGLTAGNDLFLLGIPFTPSDFSTLTKNTAPVSTSTVNNAANSYLTAILHDNTNYMRIQENITNATNDYILVSEITSGTSDLNFTLTYFTDS